MPHAGLSYHDSTISHRRGAAFPGLEPWAREREVVGEFGLVDPVGPWVAEKLDIGVLICAVVGTWPSENLRRAVILDPDFQVETPGRRAAKSSVGVNERAVLTAGNLQIGRIIVAAPVAHAQLPGGRDEVVCFDERYVGSKKALELLTSPLGIQPAGKHGLVDNSGDLVQQVFGGKQGDSRPVRVRLAPPRQLDKRRIVDVPPRDHRRVDNQVRASNHPASRPAGAG